MASKSRKRGREREKENVCSSSTTQGIVNTQDVASKGGNWTISEDVGSDPPLLADMGLSILQDDESIDTDSITPLPNKVLTARDQNICQDMMMDSASQDNEFFVYKRRRLEHVGGEDKFNRMVDECILMIFKKLPKFTLTRCAQVCKRWKRLAFDESLWRRLDLSSKNLKAGVVGRVILRGTNTLRLAKSEVSSPIFCPQLHHLQVEQRASIKSHLTYLDLTMATINPESIAEIFEVCHELKKISLEHCTITHEACQNLAKNTNLETLNLAMCYTINEDSLACILSSCTRLQHLNLAWTGLSSIGIKKIGELLPRSLQRLNLSGCRGTLEDFHVHIIARQCPDLLELDMSDANNITTVSLVYIQEFLRNVEHLAFSRCYSIPPDAYLTLGNRVPSLLHLDIYGVLNDMAVVRLQQSLPNIRINRNLFSTIARPTVGIRRTSIWGRRVRD